MIRRLDHVAVSVADTERAIEYFSGRLGLEVVASQVVEQPHVRLTYLDAGNAYIQLVEPLDGGATAEGLHHICFGVDEVESAAVALADPGSPAVALGGGRGRVSAFVPGARHHGVAIECTEFKLEEDVHGNTGWLDD
jgi:catechol 2,3-dioxygenase-like lactoylglutathione lyase family enzyme